MAEKKLQTEMVGLPSKGLLYPESSPLRSGAIEVKYMTAKEEDILTNQTYIKSGGSVAAIKKKYQLTSAQEAELKTL